MTSDHVIVSLYLYPDVGNVSILLCAILVAVGWAVLTLLPLLKVHILVTIIIAIVIIVLINFTLLLFQVNVVRRPNQPLEFFDEAEDRLLLHHRTAK